MIEIEYNGCTIRQSDAGFHCYEGKKLIAIETSLDLAKEAINEWMEA